MQCAPLYRQYAEFPTSASDAVLCNVLVELVLVKLIKNEIFYVKLYLKIIIKQLH